MRDIEVNFTDKGLEVLFDGWPSPRFERYMGNAQCIFRWLRRAGRVFIIGPAQAFGLTLLVGLLDGSLGLSANVTEDLQQVNLVVSTGPAQQPLTIQCQAGAPRVRTALVVRTVPTLLQTRPGICCGISS